ncbi:MAG: VTT domain-containing protein [Betaproteobacteria bacterium]|jgi:membrane protein DedA with SNARE-associated domain/rhodanese-related sulfurtransferase|nr:VTT domain-containing protein [Betaproteobacteria bacterium]MCC7215533.1 VTT domain-containing protein [Burkholderiales bacterium]
MEQLVELIQHYGLALVFVNVLMLQSGLPVPAYPTLIVTGALVARGGAPLWELLAVAVAASLIADFGWYTAGRKYGSGILQSICRVSLSPDSCVRQTESIFSRWGARSLAVAKFIPGFASVATSMAGVVRLPVWKFALFDAIGATLWSGVAIGLGYAFSGAINQVLGVFETLGKVGLWLIAGGFVAYIAVKWWQRELFIWQLRMDRVTVDELSDLMRAERVGKVIDVRTPMSQALTGRIPGAITVDPNNMRVDLLAIEPDSEVVVYCACPNEYTAAKIAKVLVEHGFKRVRPLLGGIDAWIAAGHPVEAAETGGARVVPLHVRKTPT